MPVRRGQRVVRSRFAAGLVLLFLTAHAFVASATHFHRPAPAAADPAQTVLRGLEEGGEGTPLAGGDAQCLLCRLQRDFASGVPNAAVTLAPPQFDALNYEPLQNASAHAARSHLYSGRAPPRI